MFLELFQLGKNVSRLHEANFIQGIPRLTVFFFLSALNFVVSSSHPSVYRYIKIWNVLNSCVKPRGKFHLARVGVSRNDGSKLSSSFHLAQGTLVPPTMSTLTFPQFMLHKTTLSCYALLSSSRLSAPRFVLY